MDNFTLFYAWQSDLPPKSNRYFIRDAAKAALHELSNESVLEESPRLDHDTRDTPGTPEIAATIFGKIDKAGLLLADVSFVGRSGAGDRLPNPNVLLELGYAAARIGWDRTLLVMNTFFDDPEHLPFDLKHRRWPITYHLDDSNPADPKGVLQKLTANIKVAISLASQEEHASVLRTIGKLDIHCLRWMSDLGSVDWFSQPPRSNMGEIVGNLSIDAALIRLIELGVLRCDVNPAAGKYAYHWTYFGKLVLYHLGLRSRPAKA